MSSLAIGSNAASSLISLLEQANQTQGVSQLASAATGLGGSSSSPSVGGVGQDSATVSGPGQIFSQLQQLQSQDPTEFKQVVSTIASQLQTAASQTTGNQSQFLSTLASNFNTAATTGNLASLEPHHRGHEGHGTYNQAGQVTPTSSSTTGSSTSTGGLNVQQLFANISSEVTQALAGITSGTTATASVPGQS